MHGRGASILAALIIMTAIAAVFALFSFLTAQECVRLLALQDRLAPARCTVIAHRDGERVVRANTIHHLAGLVVRFSLADGTPVVNATALADIERERAWLTTERRHDLFRNPSDRIHCALCL
jgi:hypothetical protein